MTNLLEIEEARRVLGLGEAATIKEIKRAYRSLARRYHPDQSSEDNQDQDAMKKLNWVYKVLEDYCRDYKYSFCEEDVARTYPYEEHLRQFHNKWFDSI